MKFPFLLFALLVSVPAFADSDGYYCLGPNYLAYERRFEKSDGEPRHTLYEVQAGGKTKLLEIRTFVMPDFQVHGLKCGADSVDVLAWESIYTIGRAGKTLELSKKTALAEAGKLPKGYEASWFRRIEPENQGSKALPFPGGKPSDKTYDNLEYNLKEDYKACRVKLGVRVRRYWKGKPGELEQPKLVGEQELFSDEQPGECGD